MTQEPETPKLDLSIPRKDRKTEFKPPKSLIFLNIVVLLALLVDIGLSARISGSPGTVKSGASLSADARKELALKLEKQELHKASVSAWQQYLSEASLDDKETAKIWYRIGKLYQQDGQYEPALESFYLSESFATVPELSPEIARRVQECLESMGKFAALRYELSDRVGMGGQSSDENKPVSKGDEVVAEIGPEKITKSDLDRWVESQIDRQLSQMAPYLSDEQLKQQKEEILKQFSSSSRREMLLNQLIGEEILYRKARESKLLEDPKVQAEIKSQERALLAQNAIQREFSNKINITEGDLKTYYEAHLEDYKTEAEERKEPVQKSFEEVRNDIYRTLRSEKEQEVQRRMLDELREAYDVVLHLSAFAPERPEQGAAPVTPAPPPAPAKGAGGDPSGKAAPARGAASTPPTLEAGTPAAGNAGK